MESLLIIRQMMAGAKFFEAQTLIEAQISGAKAELRFTLIQLLAECLQAQDKEPPVDLILELAINLYSSSPAASLEWFSKISNSTLFSNSNNFRIMKMHSADARGNLEQLRNLISEFQLSQIENSVPVIPSVVSSFIEKYFKHDWQLKLQSLALCLAIDDLTGAEALTKELMLAIFEHNKLKANTNRWESLSTVLSLPSVRGGLIILRNFCQLYLNGISSKKDHKSLTELVIYLEDFKFQIMLLKLFQKLELNEVISNYAPEVRKHQRFDFVYIEKHFPEMKAYFSQKPKAPLKPAPTYESPDFSLDSSESAPRVNFNKALIHDIDQDEENKLIQLFKYQDFSSFELCEIAVSFLQSDLPRVALEAAQSAVNYAVTDKEYLKAAYLKIICLMQLKDYRRALDFSMEAIKRALSQEDIVSIMYVQAEAYIQLDQKKPARTILNKILNIDANYRLSKERLEKLNEV